jgi:tripartite-type tricarboxylate transporter receptor subunit TctC
MKSNLRLPGIHRRHALAAIAGSGMLASSLAISAEGPWRPDRPVKLVVPYPPGGSVDIIGRMVAPGLNQRLGQPVIVDNRGGATGTIGAGYVYAAPPDGTTLLVGVSDPLSIYPQLAKTSYDPKKFVPITKLGSTAYVLLTRPGLPVKNLQEFIALARKQPLSYGNAGMGGSLHMVTLAFGRAANIRQMLHVPFTGGAPALQALVGGQIDALLTLIGGATEYRSRARFLGVTSERRVDAVRDVPTFTEQGLPFERELWVGMFAPPGTPAQATSTLATALSEIVRETAYKARLAELAIDATPTTQAEFSRYYFDEIRSWGEVIRTSNVKLQ